MHDPSVSSIDDKMEHADMRTSDSRRTRILDFNQRQSVPVKIWMTFVLMLMGSIMLLPYILLDDPFYKDAPRIKFAVMRLVEMVEVFVVFAIIFVWYRPSWIHGMYLRSERRMSLLYFLTCAAFCLGILWMAIWSVFSLLFGK